MHPIDRAASLLFRHGPASVRVFSEGWGDEALLGQLEVEPQLAPPAAVTVAWGSPQRHGDVEIRDGTFASPAAHLPSRSRRAHVRMIRPAAGVDRLVVALAAWNDHGYRTRTHLADRLVRRGIATVMLENPLYGVRRAWEGVPVRTVADFAVMGRAAVVEGRALLGHFAANYDVGVTGYSMGANIAALVGATMPFPVAIAPLAASHSPGPVWLDGVIRHAVDWPALGGEQHADRLRHLLTSASALRVPPAPHTAGAVIVGARRDGYIPRRATEELHAHWPGSELRWLPGGHATLIWLRKDALADAVVTAFNRTFAANPGLEARDLSERRRRRRR